MTECSPRISTLTPISLLGPKPELSLPFYDRSETPVNEVVPEDPPPGSPIIVLTEKPGIELPYYIRDADRTNSTHDPSDWTANIKSESSEPQTIIMHSNKADLELPYYIRSSHHDLTSSSPGPITIHSSKADLELPYYNRQSSHDLTSRSPTRHNGPAKSLNTKSPSPEPIILHSRKPDLELPYYRHTNQTPRGGPSSDWSANIHDPEPPAYNDDYKIPPAMLVQRGPLTKTSPPFADPDWSNKKDEELRLEIQQEDALHRMVTMDRKERKRQSLLNSLRLKLFRQNTVHSKAGNTRRTKTKSLRQGDTPVDIHRVYSLNEAQQIQFKFQDDPPIWPDIAKQFVIDFPNHWLTKTATGEMCYELDKEEGELLRNCDKHPYIRRSRTWVDQPNPLERTEFGSFIRRHGTISLPTSYAMTDTATDEFNEFLGYRKLCLKEKKSTQSEVNLEKHQSAVHEIRKLSRDECRLTTPPPPTPPAVEYTPIQYQYTYTVPEVRVVTAEPQTRAGAARQYTGVMTPVASPVVTPAVSPFPETLLAPANASRVSSRMSLRAYSRERSRSLPGTPVGSPGRDTRSALSRRRIRIDLNPDSPYMNYNADKDEAIQAAQYEVETTTSEAMREQENSKFRKIFKKMSQKRRKADELTNMDRRRTEVVNAIYLGGKLDAATLQLHPTPPTSPLCSDPGLLDEDEGFDEEHDQGLRNILTKIRALTNASVMELKSYKAPPAEVHSVVKCVFMILGEDLKQLEHWQECLVLLSKLGRKHIRKRVLNHRKDRVTVEIRENARKILTGWTSYLIAEKSRVCVLFFIWCKEICDLNDRPEDNPLLPVVMGRFMYKSRLARLALSTPASGRSSAGEERTNRMVLKAADSFKLSRHRVLPAVNKP